MTATDAQPRDPIARALQYDRTALELNARGRISRSQTFRLLRRALAYATLGLIILGLNSACAFAIWSETFTVLHRGSLDWWASLAGGGLFAVLGIVFTAHWSRQSLYVLLDLLEGRASFVTGPLRRYASQVRGSWNYFLEVDNRQFKVPGAAHAMLADGAHLRIYYGPRSAIILSLQSLDE